MKAICQLVIALIVVPILLGCSKASKPMPVIVQTAAKGFNTPWDVGEEKLCFTAPDAVIDNMPVHLLTAGKVVSGDASTKTPSQTVWNCTKRPNGSIDCR